MKVEIYNGYFLGSAEWRGPKEVVLEMDDPGAKQWFERYFNEEDSFLTGSVDCPSLTTECRSDSEESFTRAAESLGSYNYRAYAPGTGPDKATEGARA
ncbi:MAG: hypothetical protein QOH26_160 [Actinomycetota bacterium]|jgi:hypothetical protein|nr:hypothetical protein [Actinomycetota bacterium]